MRFIPTVSGAVSPLDTRREAAGLTFILKLATITLLCVIGMLASMPAHAYYQACRAAPAGQWPASAGDAIAAEIEAGRLDSPTQGLVAGMSYSALAPIVHANFPQIIEQNIAAMGPKALHQFFGSIGQNELSDLAQLYVNATEGAQRPGRLLDLLAARATPAQLGRLSEHFGYGRVQAAVGRMAPSKMNEFQRYGSAGNVGPLAGENRFGPRGRFLATGALRAGAPDISFGDYTPYEVYMDFRTAPVGSLSVGAALFETSLVLTRFAGPAWAFGWAVGTGLGALIEEYSPSTWDAIGGTIDVILDNIGDLFSTNNPALIGPAQSGLAGAFAVPDTVPFLQYGGDYGVAYEWADWGGGIVWNCRR